MTDAIGSYYSLDVNAFMPLTLADLPNETPEVDGGEVNKDENDETTEEVESKVDQFRMNAPDENCSEEENHQSYSFQVLARVEKQENSQANHTSLFYDLWVGSKLKNSSSEDVPSNCDCSQPWVDPIVDVAVAATPNPFASARDLRFCSLLHHDSANPITENPPGTYDGETFLSFTS